MPRNFSRRPEDCFTRSGRLIMVSMAVKEPTAFILLKSSAFLLPSSFFSTTGHEMVYSPFKTKMVACYDQDSTSGGEGAGPQPAHAGSGLRFQDGDSLCNRRDRR